MVSLAASIRLLTALALSLGVGACTRAQAPQADSRMTVRPMDTPAGPGSGEPNLTVATDGRVLLSWIEPTTDKTHALRYASRAKGGSWSEAATIAEGSNWFVNWADFPSLATLSDGTLFAHWLAKSGSGAEDYDVRITLSRDGGKSWSQPVVPHRDGTQTEHGFVSMTPWSAAEMGVVWLDGRKAAGGAPSHGEHGDAQAEMSLLHTTLAADGRLGPETILDPRVCDCCQTDMARAVGATVVVYRDRSEKEVRDMSVVRYVDGRWSEPRPLARDGWEINGCPVNGPAIAAAGRSVAVAWFAAPAEKPRVSVVFSSDSGATFGQPIVVSDQRPLGRVDVVLTDQRTALVSWLEQVDKSARLQVQRITADGVRGQPVTVTESSQARSSGFPRMVQSDGEITIAWRDAAESPTIRTAVLPVPIGAR
jgi:hypothetical protein